MILEPANLRTFANCLTDCQRTFWQAYEDSKKAEAECRVIIQDIKESQRLTSSTDRQTA